MGMIHMAGVSHSEGWLLWCCCGSCQPIIEVESLLELFFSAKPFPAPHFTEKQTRATPWSSGPGFAGRQQKLALAKNPDVEARTVNAERRP
jgi:hypothetical protein